MTKHLNKKNRRVQSGGRMRACRLNPAKKRRGAPQSIDVELVRHASLQDIARRTPISKACVRSAGFS